MTYEEVMEIERARNRPKALAYGRRKRAGLVTPHRRAWRDHTKDGRRLKIQRLVEIGRAHIGLMVRGKRGCVTVEVIDDLWMHDEWDRPDTGPDLAWMYERAEASHAGIADAAGVVAEWKEVAE